MGAPRLHEWIAMTEAIFRIIRISSRVAPASSARRMWRRVPSGFRFVQAAFTARLINSIVFRGRTPFLHGSVVIFTHASAQFGSYSRSVSNAASHGPVVCRVAGVPGGASVFIIDVTFLGVDVQTSALSGPPGSTQGHRGFCPGSYGPCPRRDPASLAVRQHRGPDRAGRNR